MFFLKKNNLIIVRSDGGICSQIGFLALGKYLEDKGYEIKYDLSWFDECGTDLYGKEARNYSIDKAFPGIKIKRASVEELKKYNRKRYRPRKKSVPENYTAPMYVCGYPPRVPYICKYKEYLKQNFAPVDLGTCSSIAEEIGASNSCCIHVRRGDLSNYNKDYGYPPDEEYFIKAIKLVNSLDKVDKFYFFSDDTEWVKDKIIPHLNKNISYKVCSENGSDKGYLDLYLMSKAKFIIASQGSLGRYAKILSNRNPTIITYRYFPILTQNFENVIYLNEDVKKELVINNDSAI